MMKSNKNKIYSLKIDIEDLQKRINSAIDYKRPATAKRLSMILERKQELLDSWISNG
jgi:hypothetical protein